MKFTLFFTVLAAAMCLAQAPSYDPFMYMHCGGSVIDVGYYGAPSVADWNNDGAKDMVLGIFSNGNIRFYANENTNDSPVFNTYSNLQAGGVDITLPYG